MARSKSFRKDSYGTAQRVFARISCEHNLQKIRIYFEFLDMRIFYEPGLLNPGIFGL